MRLSVITSDPGFDPIKTNMKVFLDGVYLDNCLTADEEEGMVLIYSKDKNGLYIRLGMSEIQTEVKYGKVKIVG